jgi:4'-phosphopantetheinyl transferase
VRGSYGKPAIAQPHQVPVHFNLAHSGDWALVGVTHCEAIGADIEAHRNLPDLESVARRFFSPNETRDLMAIPDSQRIAAFFRVWTRKEAYVKASGHGLHKPLDSFDVSVNADARVLRDVVEDLAMDHWHMGDMPTISGHTGAVVVAHRSDVPDTICWIQDSD